MPKYGGRRQRGCIHWLPLLLVTFLWLKRMVAMTTEEVPCFSISSCSSPKHLKVLCTPTFTCLPTFGEKWGQRKRTPFKGIKKELVSASYPESTHDTMGLSLPLSPHPTPLHPSAPAPTTESPDKNKGQARRKGLLFPVPRLKSLKDKCKAERLNYH